MFGRNCGAQFGVPRLRSMEFSAASIYELAIVPLDFAG
jgi:hypothetical protein